VKIELIFFYFKINLIFYLDEFIHYNQVLLN